MTTIVFISNNYPAIFSQGPISAHRLAGVQVNRLKIQRQGCY